MTFKAKPGRSGRRKGIRIGQNVLHERKVRAWWRDRIEGLRQRLEAARREKNIAEHALRQHLEGLDYEGCTDDGPCPFDQNYSCAFIGEQRAFDDLWNAVTELSHLLGAGP